jgi:pimeloyl-ACP methyl ester carboxylesterase
MDKFEQREWITLSNGDQRFFGVLHLPLEKKRSPAVLICHGFAGNKTGRSRQYVRVAEELAKNGIVALRVDYRGCGDSEGALEEMRLSGNIADACKGLEYLSKHPRVIREEIGVLGCSLGGAIAIQTALKNTNVKSIVLWAPVSNSKQWQMQWFLFRNFTGSSEVIWLNNTPYQRKFVRDFFTEFFEIQPAKGLEQLGHLPMMHVHGDKDTVVPIDHMREYEKYRKNATAPSRFLRLPNMDHNLFDPDEIHILIKESVGWFLKTLKS